MAVNEDDVILTICSRGNGKSPVGEEESQGIKVEAYRVLTSHLKQSSSELLPQLLVKFQEILPLTLSDAGAANEEIAIAALKFLSSCLFDQSLANSAQAEVVVPVLCELALRQQSSNEVITHLLWCLNDHKMNCSTSLLTTHVKVQVLMMSQLIMSYKHSLTVEAECINLLHRLYKDQEETFVQLDPMMWYPSLVILLTGDHEQDTLQDGVSSIPPSADGEVQNIKEAYQLANELQPLVTGNPEVAGSLAESLKEKLASALYKQFTNKKIEQTTLLIWQHFVCVLDRELHKYGNWFNSFLKIVEQAFKHSNVEIQIAAYKAWRCLIENYALNLRILVGSRRMKLIMTPLAGFPTQSRQEQVDVERFTVWQYLIEQLSSKRSHCVKQVITPLLLFSVGIDSRLSSVVLDEWALDGAYLSITPTTPTSRICADSTTEVLINIICHHGDDTSVISSPRTHPGIVYQSVLSSCCQLVMSLCGRPPANQVTGAVVPVIDCGDGKAIFMKQPRAFLLFIEAILQLFPIVSSEVCHDLWQAVFHRVTMALTDPGILSATPLVLPMISILRIALKNKKLQQLTVIIVTELCQLYHKVPFKLSSSDQMFVLSSLSNKKVLPWQFLLETILHHPVILQKIEMVAMVTVLKFCFANVKDFIKNASLIIDMLKLSAPSNKQQRWLLFDVWNNFISIITEKVSKVGKLLEDNLTECNTLLCDLLAYPVELLYASVAIARAVPIEVRAKLMPAWTKLIEAVAMVTTSESTNNLVAMVLNRLTELFQEQKAEIYMLCALTKICLSSIVHVNFTKGNPSKVVDAHLKLVNWILMKTSQSEKLQQEAMTTSLFSGLVDVTIKIFTLLRGVELVLAGLDHVIPHLTDIFNQLHNRFNGDRSSLHASLRKVWSAIATCLQARYTGGYSSELLAMLSPMLVLMLSLRDRGRHNNSLCSQMLTFWCATFAKEATLVYPDKLCDALKEFRHMGGRIELPGWPEDEKIVTVIADSLNGHEENSSDLMDSLTGSHKAQPSANLLQIKGKNYLRARRKLPWDYYNNENTEISPVTKKKRLLSRYQKPCDTPKLYKSSEQHSTQSNIEHSSIEEISQSNESPAIHVPMVIACEVNPDERVDVTDDDSLLFDSNTPISMIPITNSHFSISNSQESIETEQDSLSTIPETAEDQMRSMEQDDVDNIGVVNGNHSIGEIPNSEDVTSTCLEGDNNSNGSISNSPSHLLDHTYTALQNGEGVVSSHEKLWCEEKIASMITPVSKKSVITLFKDNGCHAARCSIIKRSNRTFVRIRRHQRQITSLSSKKSQKKNLEVKMASNKQTCAPMERLVQGLVPSSQAETSSCNDNLTSTVKSGTKSIDFVAKDHNIEQPQPGRAVKESIDTVTRPMDTVTQPMVTVTQLTASVTQPVITVTQPTASVTQSMVLVTQSTASVTDAVTQSIGAVIESNKRLETTTNSLVTCTQSCSLTNPKVTTHRKDSVTDHIDPVTQLVDTATHEQRSRHTMTQDMSHTSNVGQHNHDVRTAILRSNLQLLQYNHLMKQLAIKTMSTTLLSKHSDQLPCSSLLHGGPSVTGGDKMACLYNMLSSCLVNAEMNVSSSVPATCRAVTSHHIPPSSNQLLPVIHNVFSNVNTTQFPFSNRQLPGIIRQRQPIGMFTAKPLIAAATQTSTFVNSPCLQIDSMTTSSVVNSASVTIPVSVSSSVPSSAKPSLQPIRVGSLHVLLPNSSSVTALTSANSNVAYLRSLNSSVTSVNSSSVTSSTSVNSLSVTSVNSSITSLMSVNSPSVTSLTTVNSSVTSLTSVNSLSVTSLTSVNSSVTSSTSVNSPSVTSLTSVNSSITSSMSVNSSSVSSLTTANSLNVTSLASPSVTSLTSVESLNNNVASVNSSVKPSTSVGSIVTSLSFNSPNVTSLTSVDILNVTSVNSSVKSLMSVGSVTSVNSPSVASSTSANSLNVTSLASINSPNVTSLTTVDSSNASLTSVNSLNINVASVNSSVEPSTSVGSIVKSLMSVGSSISSVTSVNSPSVTSSTSVNSLNVTSLNSPSVSSSTLVDSGSASLTPVNLVNVASVNSSVKSLVSVGSSVTSLTSVNSGLTPLASINSPSVTLLTTVNSPSVTSLTSVNSPSVISLTSLDSPNVTSLTSVDSSNASLTSVNSLNINVASVNSSVSLLSLVNSPNVASLTSVNSSVTGKISDKSSPVISNHTGSVKDAEIPVNSIASVSLETVPQATVSESIVCNSTKQSGDNTDSPPHTPTGGILKRVSQFDTPNTSGKRRRVSFADTVENYSDVYNDRRYVTSPRSKLHSKVSPRRLLPKPEKISSTGKTKSSSASSPNVDYNSLPTYPALRSCDTPVDAILSDLISSPMARSLGKLFHAREIRTVGHLASLPENQVKSLPIQQPKLKTLKSTLELFEKQLEQSNSKVANGDKSIPLSRGSDEVQTATELTSLDHVITSHDYVNLDDVTTISDKQITLVEPLTTPPNDSVTSSHTTNNTTSVTMATADQQLDTPTCGSGLAIPNRMQYLTESCSYDNSNDDLILATPESQSVKEDEQVGLLATANNNTTCSNEDPLVITDKPRAPTDEGNSLQEDTPAVGSRIPQSRTALHNRLQTIAARKFPHILTELNTFLKFLEDCHLDNDDLELAVSVVIDGLDHMLASNSSP